MLKPDHHIQKLAQEGMITPFEEKLIREGVISYGLSSFGYDIRLADEFKIFTNVHSAIVDPKNFDPKSFIETRGVHCIIPPNSFILARSYEYIKMPKNVLAICLGKSTYARCGLIVNVTPLEPGWEGYITMEISNTTPLPAKVYANEGIAQLIFLEGHEPPRVTYDSRKGKYQKQVGIQLPKI
ncbi:MAG: dCTP deaminase [Parcubacteria group bacterium RIFCSPLOWO2_01_FULL_48_18]|nr:MAG: dCTP deaminase [Parcubacteria group bacterium RIFCSPHIGHO2_02_FULL_48_10b]OHB22803.1 MAG: dCTP deaminase [Parcubacteria group bacterium RIFCSPLOWO2_01_FULL_48_18]